MTRHFLASDDWKDEDILGLLHDAEALKKRAEIQDDSLSGKILGMVFFNPSLRSRTSFEVAMLRHGGHAVTLEPGSGVWTFEVRPGAVMDGSAAEHVVEAARVLGRYVDVLGVRAFPSGDRWEEARRDPILQAFAAEAGIPVVNFESARRHPCQGLADAMTIRERFGEETKGKRFVLSWAWHPSPLPTAVPVSAVIHAARLGMEVTVARPPGYDFDPEDVSSIEAVAARNGGSFETTDRYEEAIEGADVIYAKSWGSLELFGYRDAELQRRAPFREWRIDESRMNSTRDGDGVFLHCLPIRRNVIATDGVLDGPWSRVIDQAENRLHVQRALLRKLLRP